MMKTYIQPSIKCKEAEPVMASTSLPVDDSKTVTDPSQILSKDNNFFQSTSVWDDGEDADNE